jgi:hypothetical protein
VRAPGQCSWAPLQCGLSGRVTVISPSWFGPCHRRKGPDTRYRGGGVRGGEAEPLRGAA